MQQSSDSVAGWLWQGAGILLCMTLAVLMVLNTQMSGEAMWFWYGTTFRNGAKLYSELHTALQPLFVIETGTWLRLFGKNLALYEIPSLIHAFLLALGTYLVLRESSWPDWQKAIVLVGTFVFTVCGHSYRFDDYHVVAETLITYALLLLLLISRPDVEEQPRRQLVLAGLLGLVCGLTIVTRITDGAALTTASAICLVFLLRRRTLGSLGVFVSAVAITVVFVVKLTGDSLSAYVFSSILRAAGSKGGTGSIFAAPFLVIGNTIPMLATQKKIPAVIAIIIVLGIMVKRRWPRGIRYLVPIQLAATGIVLLFASPVNWIDLKRGLLFEDLVLFLTLIMYVFAGIVLVRFLRHVRGNQSWDRRQILILLPILEWASYSAGAAAEPLTNYYQPVALLLLLIPVLQPFRRYAVWANPTLVTVLALVAINGIASKVIIPYSWQNYKYGSMFKDREWYHHPVYGEMYIDRDLLQFSKQVCVDIGAVPGKTAPPLLSLPYPYPNYFCDTPPWHNYVQTFFDTATRGTVDHLMAELQADPPKWIIYQRQINIMRGSERLYNHGQPIAQRSLDAMVAQKLASGQWTLADHSDYLRPTSPQGAFGTGWYIIRTRP